MKKPTRARHSEALAVLRGELKEFQVQLINALDKPVLLAEYSQVADTLGNKTPAEIQALALAEVAKHTSKLGVNAHGLDPHDLGTYNQQEYDDKFDLMLDTSSGIPLDFYGDREFLPPGVSGSYESGSSTTPWLHVAMMLEDNGTLMMLRSGTDGDSSGVYYSYLRNAMTETDINKNLLMSNLEYRPAYFPSDMKAMCVLSGTQDIVIGIMKNRTTGARTGYFISLTNNTMDMTKHTGVFIPDGNFIDVKGPFPAIYHLPFGFVKGNYVYVLHDLHEEGKIGHRVWRLNKNELITGVFSSATRIKGWTINRGSGGTVARDDIVIFDNVDQANIKAGKDYTLAMANNGSTTGSAVTRDDGRTVVWNSHYVQYYPTDNLISVQGWRWWFTYEFDIASKVIDVAKYHDRKNKMIYGSSGWEPQESAAMQLFAKHNYQSYQGGQTTDSLYCTVYNQMWIWTTISYVTMLEQRWLVRVEYDETLDTYDVLSGDAALSRIDRINPVGKFGSPVTSGFCAVSNVGDDTLNVLNYGNTDGVADEFYVSTKIIGEPTFQYSSTTGNYAFKGFAPNNRRVSQRTSKIPYDNFRRLLNEGSPGVSRTSQARFGTWWTNDVTRAAQVNADMTTSGTVTVPRSVIASLETQLLSNLATRNIRKHAPITGGVFAFELIIPQIYTDMPAFVVGSIIGEERIVWKFVYSVTLQGTRQNVTGATLNGSSGLMIRLDYTPDILLLGGLVDCGQMAIRRVTNGFSIGYADDTYHQTVGNGGRAFLALNYLNGNWSINGGGYWDYYTPVAPGGWVNLPSRGLYFVLSSEYIYGEIDCGTKMVATLYAANNAGQYSVDQLKGRAMLSSTAFIMLSQRVVDAWTVYFSDITPAMLDGDYYPVEPTTYELDESTDGNKTFHVWLVKEGGKLVYKVVVNSTTAPASRALYLGYFTTTSTGIGTIQIEKRVAIDGNLISPDVRGSSIPVTSGTPNQYGRLNWS